jgi:hypothetical protein
MKTAMVCALMVAGLVVCPNESAGTQIPPASAGFAACTAPPAPGGTKKTVAAGHAKPSSFAPQPRAPHRAYGAPIQPPIVSKHPRHKRRTNHSPTK